jgi:hypothetical protein
MERHPNEAETALAAMWANELGGRLMAKLLDELYGSKKPLREEPDLFEASEQKFVAFGKTKLEHRAWRQREVKLLRFTQLEYLTWSINQDHPRFTTDATDEGEPEYLPIGTKPIREPDITLQELDAEITEWYLQKEKETTFEVPAEIKASALRHEPDSVTYMRWMYAFPRSDEAPKPKTIDKVESDKQKEAIGGEEEWRFISADDLEGENLNDEQASALIHKWLLEAGEGKTRHKPSDIKNSLKNAQCEASRVSRQNGRKLPVRLRKESSYYFNHFAMTQIAPPGRPRAGGSSSTYKLIKASILAKDTIEQTPDSPSGEPPQG